MRQRSSNRFRLRGAALVEAACCLALAAPLLIGGFQFAFALYQRVSLEAAVEHAARYGSLHPADEGKIVRVAVYGNPEGEGPARIPGLEAGHFRVEVSETESARRIRVSVHGFRLSLPGGAKPLEGTPSAWFPVVGQPAAESK
jgi:hypothetical protein